VIEECAQSGPVPAHALEQLDRGPGQHRIGQCRLTLVGHLLHHRTQLSIQLAGLTAGEPGFASLCVPRKQAADVLHPGQRPWPQFGIVVGQHEQVAPLVRPAKQQGETRMQAGEFLVGTVPVTADRAPAHAGEHLGGNGRRARWVEHVIGHGGRLKDPQVPAVAALALDVDKHLPARLVGVPVLPATQLVQQPLIERHEQRGDGPQAPSERAHRHVQAMIGQILHQAVTGPPVQEFVQQHADPHRDAEFTAFDQPSRRRCRNDAGYLLALARAPISPPPDQPPIGPDLDLHDLAVVGTRKGTERLTADRTRRRVEFDILGAHRQLRLPRTTMTGRTTLLSAWPRPACGSSMLAVDHRTALALTAEQALLQIPDPGMRRLQVMQQRRLPLLRTLRGLSQSLLV